MFVNKWGLNVNIMTKKLVWRLGKLPTPEEVQNLVKDKIITNEEARDILFKTEEETERDIDSFKAEIKFLRELVEKLSDNKVEITKIVEREYPVYKDWSWYGPYKTWCSSGTVNLTGNSTITLASNSTSTTYSTGFSAIDTF